MEKQIVFMPSSFRLYFYSVSRELFFQASYLPSESLMFGHLYFYFLNRAPILEAYNVWKQFSSFCSSHFLHLLLHIASHSNSVQECGKIVILVRVKDSYLRNVVFLNQSSSSWGDNSFTWHISPVKTISYPVTLFSWEVEIVYKEAMVHLSSPPMGWSNDEIPAQIEIWAVYCSYNVFFFVNSHRSNIFTLTLRKLSKLRMEPQSSSAHQSC